MSTRATARFEITGWKPYNDPKEDRDREPADVPTLSRVTVTKTFRGEVEGTSTAELLMCQSADGQAGGYVAQERVEGRLADRSGTFVIQHAGVRWATGQKAFRNVVPASGTGELRGLRGEAEIQHDEQGTALIRDYDFE